MYHECVGCYARMAVYNKLAYSQAPLKDSTFHLWYYFRKTLAVSKKLRKLRAQNAKLKKQLYDASLTTPVTRHGSQAQQFMHKYSKYVRWFNSI